MCWHLPGDALSCSAPLPQERHTQNAPFVEIPGSCYSAVDPAFLLPSTFGSTGGCVSHLGPAVKYAMLLRS